MTAVTVAGWQLIRQARAVGETGAAAVTKPAVCQYFLETTVAEALGLARQIHCGSNLLFALSAQDMSML
jgi:hypothetical protein